MEFTDLSWTQTTVVAAVLLVAYRVVFLARYARLEKQFGAKPPQVTLSDGLFGFRMVFQTIRNKRLGTSNDRACERFDTEGDTFAFRVAGTYVVNTRDPENIKAILSTQFDDFYLGARSVFLRPLLGDGIFTLDGDGWKHLRAMLRPQFVKEQVAHVQLFERHFQLLRAHIAASKGHDLDLQKLMLKFTIDTATEILFGESCDSLRDASIGYAVSESLQAKQEFATSFNVSQVISSNRATAQRLYFLVDSKKYRDCNRKVHAFADHFVHKALSMLAADLEKASTGKYVFMYELVKKTRDPRVLRDQMLNILLAGRDTTAVLLLTIFLELARSPRIWKKLQEEIWDRFGKGDLSRVEEITFESLKRCKYLKSVINETLRLYPPVSMNFRQASKNTTLPRGGGPDGKDKMFIAKGQAVYYGVYSMHRDRKYFGPDVAEFRPERWDEEACKKVTWAYLPFNGGPRICIGQQLALTETSYVVVRIMQMFLRIQTFEKEYPPKNTNYLTMKMTNGVHVGFKE